MCVCVCVHVCVVVYLIHTYSNYMYLHTYVHTSLLDIIPGDCVIIIRMLVMYVSGILHMYTYIRYESLGNFFHMYSIYSV